MVQNLARDFWSADGCQDAKPASAMNTSQDVCGEQAFHQFRPRIVPRMPFGGAREFLPFLAIRRIRAARGYAGYAGSGCVWGVQWRCCCGVVG